MMGTDHIPFASSNTEAGTIRGYIAATPSAAAYEYMLHRPGTALSIMDSFNTTMTYAIVLLILGNLDYFVSKLRMKSAKGK
jgi:K+-sensing histidine kinase KdpD